MNLESILLPLPSGWYCMSNPQMDAHCLACARAGALAALDEAIKECEQRQQKALSVQSDARGNIAHEQANVHLRMMAMYANDCATAIRRLRDTIAKGESE